LSDDPQQLRAKETAFLEDPENEQLFAHEVDDDKIEEVSNKL
jgi:hypothetical protein